MNEAFKRQIEEILPDEAEQLLQALTTEPSVSIRVNNRKTPAAPDYAHVPWCDCGYYLPRRPQFTFDPLLHGGHYYVQDASSMFIYHILRQLADGRDVTYLDLCAAPGGKSTTALEALTDNSLVVCNEIDAGRAQILRENIIKWGYPNTVVTNDNARKLGKLKNFFDIIAADMPCSGEGMFRKDEEAVRQWSPALVAECAERQKEIVDDIWGALKPGGLFIYSTCTFNREENEKTVAYIIENYEAEPIEIATQPEWNIHEGIDTPYPCYRFMPHRTNGEGLFVAVVRKAGEAEGGKLKPVKQKGKPAKTLPLPKGCTEMLLSSEKFTLTATAEAVSAMPADMAERMKQVAAAARTLHCGIPMATLKGKDLIPEHALALSTRLNREAFPFVEIDYATAIAYLRGESVTLDADTPRGFVVVAYQGSPLGFMKHLGNRSNNNYPKEWRIRSSYLPDTPPIVI